MEVPIDNNIVSARVYKKSPLRRGIITIVIVALYLFAVPYCYYTSGFFFFFDSYLFNSFTQSFTYLLIQVNHEKRQ